ncbi:MAG: DUF362 domain-containing protein [Candidatus Zhuqueibacterota bacterium]
MVACDTYDEKTIDAAVQASLKYITVLEQLVAPGTRVHIKPNLLTAKTPDKAATTHPTIVRSIVNILHSLGATVTIGDSPAGKSRPIQEYWEKTGMAEIAEQTGATLIQFEKNGVQQFDVNRRMYFIAKAVADADVVVNVSKMKTHNLTLFTGAIKNMFGSIPGFRKSEYHKQAHKARDFSRIIVDIFSAIRPQINIMDAVDIMEGAGPSAGTVNHLGLILASTDAVALDAVAAHLMGFEDGEIFTTQYAYEAGLGEKNLEKITIQGESLQKYSGRVFALPTNRYTNYVPSVVVKVLGKLIWVRPRPDENKCQRCGACIAICPTRAMSSDSGFPIIDYKKCISCFCCDEACPHNAIEQRASWLVRKIQ